MKDSVKAVVERAGSQAALARALSVSEAAVSMWVRRGWMPARRAVEVESLFGVSRWTLISPSLRALGRP